MELSRRRFIELTAVAGIGLATGCSSNSNESDGSGFDVSAVDKSVAPEPTFAPQPSAPDEAPQTTAPTEIDPDNPNGYPTGQNDPTLDEIIDFGVENQGHNDEVTVYAENWLWTPGEYDRIQKRLGNFDRISELVIAFAVPDTEGGVAIENAPGFYEMLSSVSGKTKLTLGLGGWGSPDGLYDHEPLLENWKIAAKDPAKFAGSVVMMMEEIEAATGKTIEGVDLDWEFPEVGQEQDVIAIAKAVKRASSLKAARAGHDMTLSMVVPATFRTEAYLADELSEYVDRFNVLSYDLFGDWETESGPLAPLSWTERAYNEWTARIGDKAEIGVGMPTYGWRFSGAGDYGEAFDPLAFEGFPNARDYHITQFTEDQVGPDKLFRMDGDVVNVMHPDEMIENYKVLRQIPEKSGGVFFWALSGVTNDLLNAVGARPN